MDSGDIYIQFYILPTQKRNTYIYTHECIHIQI